MVVSEGFDVVRNCRTVVLLERLLYDLPFRRILGLQLSFDPVNFVFAILGTDVGGVNILIPISLDFKSHFVALDHLMVVAVPLSIFNLLYIVKDCIFQQRVENIRFATLYLIANFGVVYNFKRVKLIQA